jgi:hypothetical protein
MKTPNKQSNPMGIKPASGRTKNSKRTEKDKGTRPFTVLIDHTVVDLMLSSAGKHLGRPWLTLAMDENTGEVVANYLSFDMPSYRSCLAVLREIVRHHGRLPHRMVISDGMEFRSRWLDRLAAGWKIVIERRPPAICRFGSIIEKMFACMRTDTPDMNTANGGSRHDRQTLAELDRLIRKCFFYDRS